MLKITTVNNYKDSIAHKQKPCRKKIFVFGQGGLSNFILTNPKTLSTSVSSESVIKIMAKNFFAIFYVFIFLCF